MWEPDPSWRPLRGAGGPGSGGLWSAERDGRRWVVKRLVASGADREHDRRHPAWWAREAEVARAPGFVDGPGLVPPDYATVEEDPEGIAVWAAEVAGTPPPGLFVARALARFATAAYDVPPWAALDQLGGRLAMVEARGGWRTLSRTPLADVADRLWSRRRHWLARLAEGPQGRVHGDAVPGNLLAERDEDVVAVDWQGAGIGPVGSDVGYFALAAREDFDALLETFVAELPPGVDADACVLAARVSAVYGVLTRAEWALAQAARGEGALAGKFRHPAVAPHLRSLQRQFPQLEALLD